MRPRASARLPPVWRLTSPRCHFQAMVSKAFGSKRVLDGIDLDLAGGESLAVIGGSGTGKSVLLRCILGLEVPDAGEILIDGMAPSRDTKKIVSYLPERTYFADWMTALQLLDFFGDFYDDFDRGAAVQMMQRLGIQPKQQIKQMSKGTREKVQLILVMSRKAKLYLLDEPIAYLDLKHQIAMLDLFSASASENKAAVAMVLHEPALAWRYSDRVLLIHGDGLTEYGPTQEMLTAGRLSALFQYPLHALECDGRVSFIPA